MAVTINASTTTGLVQSADTSGSLNIQSNGTTVLGVTSTGASVTGTQSVSGNLSFNSGYGSSAVAYGCRAWVNFNGTTNTGGFCTIRGSGNVTSVADNGTGNYTVNFTNAMPDVNYAVSGLMEPTVSNAGSDSFATSFLTTSVTLQHYEAGTLRDANPVSCVIHR
jgi:hypothetical protein